LYAGFRYYQSRRKNFPRQTLESIQGNSYATGSDVIRLYSPQAKVFVITGTSSGLGRCAALLLGGSGAHVIMGNRRPELARDLCVAIEFGGGTHDSLELDLQSLHSVQKFAQNIIKSLGSRKIDALICNAGCMGIAGQTKESFQIVWQVNAMSHALLSELLLPWLAPNGRIVSASSKLHKMCFGNRLVYKLPPTMSGSSHTDYAVSKACQVMHAHELMIRNKHAYAVEPGLVRTKIGRHLPKFMLELEYKLLGWFMFRTDDEGCATTLYCALAPLSVLGQDYYFANCAPQKPARCCANADEARSLGALFKSICKDYLSQ
jgi:WW domain-containing oxidoreductase